MLFTPYSIANITLKNRIVMSPMCMYASDDSGEIKESASYSLRYAGRWPSWANPP